MIPDYLHSDDGLGYDDVRPTPPAAIERLPGGGYAYTLRQDAVRIEARYLRRDHGSLHAEVDVQCEWIGAARHGKSLSCADLNLSSQTARRSLAKHCAERSKTKADDGFDWMAAIDGACLEVIRAERQGDDVMVLDDAPDHQERTVDVLGLHLPVDAVSLLIAHGDSLKSLLCLYVLGTLARRGMPCLYLDWEWTAGRHKARKVRLFGPERLPHLHYLRCTGPLTIEHDRIRRYCDQHSIRFLVVDSVGLACDGKLSDDDTAVRFYRALGTLPPALAAAHVPKSSLSPDAKGDAVGPFGSVFFSNLARMTWLVKKQPGSDGDTATVGLFPQKQNDGERQRPVGLTFSFTSDQITVQPANLADVEGLAEKLPLSARIAHLVKDRPLSFAEVAAELDAKTDSVIKAVTRNTRTFTRIAGADGIARIALVERRTA